MHKEPCKRKHRFKAKCTHRALLRLFSGYGRSVTVFKGRLFMCPSAEMAGRKGHNMKIRIRYENQMTTIDVPEEDFTLMIQLDYEKRLAESDDPMSVKKRSPQEIIDDYFNKPDYNNWHRHWRHTDGKPVPRIQGTNQPLDDNADEREEEHHFTMDEFPDTAAMEKRKQEEEDCELRAWIRGRLKPDYAEMVIAIHIDGMSVNDYAIRIKDNPNNVSHRLKRAEKKLKEIWTKRPI